MRAAAALALAVLAAVAWSVPARAGVLLAEDAAELAQALADAQSEQGVCYGWHLSNDFDGRPDMGSSVTGPGTAPELGQCQSFVLLTGDIHWACSSCEDEDSARIEITSNLSPAPTAADLEALGLEAGDLVGDEDDTALANMIGALPLLAAQSGAVPPVPAEVPPSVPASDRPTGKPGSDFLREAWLRLVFFVALLLGGAWLWYYKRSQERAPKEA